MKKNKSHKKIIAPRLKKISTTQILEVLDQQKGKPAGITTFLKKIHGHKPGEIISFLEQLESKKMIDRVSPGKWVLHKSLSGRNSDIKEKYIEGIVDMARGGFAYILSKQLHRDIFVAANKLKSAQNGDLVQVHLLKGRRNRPEGEVIKVITRSKSQFVGIYRKYKNQEVVISGRSNQLTEIFIDKTNKILAEDYDRVVIKITRWKDRPNSQNYGVIIHNLGKNTDIDSEMQSLLADKGFPLEFSAEALKETAEMPHFILDQDQRKDFREVLTFTIDPVDAKDFDDALSFAYNKDGDIELGVHIADVSHYVKPQTQLDIEALKRGNSVYLVDRVVPMLPERLSNDLCSLRPNEDKACFAVLFTFDAESKIKKTWIGKTIIHSKRRFAYEEVQTILDDKNGEYYTELNALNLLAKKIKSERIKNGAIDFESEEVRFRLDENKQPIELYVKQRLDAHMLIEEFMLLANKYVAQYISRKNTAAPIPFVYRIHDTPDPGKLEDFLEFAASLNVKLDFRTPKKIAQSLNDLAEKAKTKDELKVLPPLAIRTMAKAEYSTENIGHYGLAFDDYTHFTSPIRRYSDLLVHRILFDNLKKEKRYDTKILEQQCVHISSQERKAMEAERDSTKYFQVLYMKDHIGKEYDARITGMNDKNFYAEIIETKCECTLPLDLIPDQIELDASRLKAKSMVSDQVWYIGSKIRIRITSANLEERLLLATLLFPEDK